MKKLLLLLPASIILAMTPAFAQDANIAENILQDFNPGELGIRLTINITAIFILVHLIYFKRHQNKDFQFTLILFNCVNFLICYLLSGANLEVGFAFGLFAIFSIMRYRTVTVPVKEMGYLFVSVALGLINSLATTQDNYVVLISANAFILLLPLFMDRKAAAPAAVPPVNILTQDIIYERIDLIKPEMRNEMIEDLRNRTGLAIQKVDIVSIDLMQDVAVVKAHYSNNSNNENESSTDRVHYFSYSKENGNSVKTAANHV